MYCGKYLEVRDNYVEVCQCPESRLEEQAYKERAKQLARQNRKSFETARRENKVPLRGK
jgi:hypothetical protein